MEKSTYKIDAEKFMADTKTEFKAVYFHRGPYFDDDDTVRDVYKITLTRNGKSHTFKFGQSVAHSAPSDKEKRDALSRYGAASNQYRALVSRKRAPTAYDVLASLTKNDPDTFKNFCLDYGYDDDSRKAEKTYHAVVNEWKMVESLFGDVLSALQEIQ